jgi:hypothetical protein
MEQWRNNIDKVKLKNSEKTCPIATLCTRNPTWTALGVNSSLHGEKIVTNYLSCGMAFYAA